ncbi:MAG: phosphonoacetaldehyde hydrolase, partial [bacterium]
MRSEMKTGRVKTVIFDWAGTTVDYGCFAPLKVFLEIFRRRGIEVTIAEARGPMGRMKRDHIRAICETPRIRDLWISKYGAEPSEADIDSLYSDFEPALLDILPDYCEPIPEVLETVEEIRAKGISIGSTTGYTSKMMDIVIPGAKARGYFPDFVVDSSMVPAGRPYPYMIWRNCIELQSPNLAEVVKVGDTIADIKEGRNAGVWSVGVLRGSSLVGLSRDETANMPDFELESLLASAERRYLSAGAHYVANSIEDVLWIIDDIERRLSLGDTPSAPANEYKLFTPGPLTTSPTVKSRMLTDWGSRNRDYLELVEDVRRRLVELASKTPKDFTTALIQGSGTFAVEALIGTAIPADGKLLILVNGAYGERMAKIAERLGIAHDTLVCDEMAVHDLREVEEKLSSDSDVTHVAVVHCETTTGIINPVAEIGAVVKSHGAVFIVDAMSSFGGVPMDMDEMGADYLVSSANKCIQGVPGFGFAIARLAEFEKCGGRARSLSLDL